MDKIVISLSIAELEWITNSPQGLRALADYHSNAETEAGAMADFDDPNCGMTACTNYHEAKRKEYTKLAKELEDYYESC